MSNTVLETERRSETAPPQEDGGHPKRWLILAVILAVECMDLLDVTVVNVAAPSIRADLHASAAGLQWVAGGYALMFAVLLVLSARLGDLLGRRPMFLAGLGGFVVASTLCAFAPSDEVLIACRLLQGASGALVVPQGFGLIKDAFSAAELPKAMGVFGPIIGLSAVLGPILGGLLVEWNLLGTDWRLIFLINVPIGIAAFALAYRVLPQPDPGRERHPIDVPGAIMIASVAGLLVYPLIQGREQGWPVWCFVMLGAGVAGAIGFALWELRQERTGRSPLVTPSLFRKRAWTGGSLFAFAFFTSMSGLMLVQTLYLQFGLGFTAIHTGLTFVPSSLGMAIGAGLGAALLAPKLGRRVLHLGIVVVTIGYALNLWIVHAQGASLTTADLIVPFLVTGIGTGLAIAPMFSFILAAVADSEVGSASGTLNSIQQLGAAMGVAALGTVFFSAASGAGAEIGFERAIWIVLGVSVVLFALAFLMPKEGRAEDELMA